MTELRYPLTYQCKRCGEIYDGLHRSKTHVKEEHGIAWKRTRKELRVVGIHEPLPTIELLPSEKERSEKKSKERVGTYLPKSLKAHLIGIFAYKGYLNNLPIFGLREVVKRG